MKYGAVAADLGTGEEVWMTEGSVLEAARASSAIPVVFHAVRREGAGSSTARSPIQRRSRSRAPRRRYRRIGRFERRAARPRQFQSAAAGRFRRSLPRSGSATRGSLPPTAISELIDETRTCVDAQIAIAKARAQARPHLFETAYAAIGYFPDALDAPTREIAPPDISAAPDMRDALPTAFDRADEFIAKGRVALMDKREEIEALLKN